MANKEKEHKVKIENFHRPTNLGFITRIDKILNITAVARELEECPHKQTLVSRINRHTDLTKDKKKKAFAQEVGELMNELWYVLGVGLGKFPKTPHKKFKYFYRDESERMKGSIEKLEDQAKNK